ncbi:MAG: hypothetical protein QOK47_514 [Actinomycetota bacterium]|nr:hypothetical protein [Actinomycetota bacterium]
MSDNFPDRGSSFGVVLGKASYWVLTIFLIGFGLLGILSIGAPFLLLGLTLLLMAPLRKRPQIFWPSFIAVLAFFLGFGLVTPLGCTTSAVRMQSRGQPPTAETTTTVCTNLIGIDYSGTGIYNPSQGKALAAGIVSAAAGVTITRLVLGRKTN